MDRWSAEQDPAHIVAGTVTLKEYLKAHSPQIDATSVLYVDMAAVSNFRSSSYRQDRSFRPPGSRGPVSHRTETDRFSDQRFLDSSSSATRDIRDLHHRQLAQTSRGLSSTSKPPLVGRSEGVSTQISRSDRHPPPPLHLPILRRPATTGTGRRLLQRKQAQTAERSKLSSFLLNDPWSLQSRTSEPSGPRGKPQSLFKPRFNAFQTPVSAHKLVSPTFDIKLSGIRRPGDEWEFGRQGCIREIERRTQKRSPRRPTSSLVARSGGSL